MCPNQDIFESAIKVAKMKIIENPMLKNSLRAAETAGVIVLALILAGVVQAGTAKKVIQDGKTYFEIDNELFPALEALGPPPIPKDNPQTVDAEGWPLEAGQDALF